MLSYRKRFSTEGDDWRASACVFKADGCVSCCTCTGLTAVSPLMLCDGFLVSVTWTEPRMRLKLADVLHSTVTEKRSESR